MKILGPRTHLLVGQHAQLHALLATFQSALIITIQFLELFAESHLLY